MQAFLGPMLMKEWLSRIAFAAAVIVVIGIATAWLVGGELSDPMPHNIGRPPLPLVASNVTLASGSGSLIHGWYSRGAVGQGAILLLHGVRGDRRDMLARAAFLHDLNYTVLLIDFQGHGESRGDRVTFGDRESRDVVAAIQYLHHKLPGEPVGVIGVSLGAAAFVLADGRPKVEAVVLESMYPTFDNAVSSRLRTYLGPLGPVLSPLLLTQVRPRLNIDPSRLRPIDRMAGLGVPALIMNGTLDRSTSIDAARAIFAAAAEPKEFWAVEGAAHVDLHGFAKSEYERRVTAFFAAHMRPDRPVPAG